MIKLSSRFLGMLCVLTTVFALWSNAAAANLGVAVQKIDTTQFPKVRAYVSVANGQGVPITGLDQSAFTLLEDDKAVEQFQVEPIVDSQEPIAVVMAIDVSGSMNDQGKIDGARKAATAFVDTLGPKDSVALISFSDQVHILQGYTSDHAALKNGIGQLKAQGDTAIYDAIIEASLLQGAVPQQRKVILLLTDGEDTKSKQSLDAALAAATRAKVPVFAVGLGTDVKKDVLDKIAGSTSGQAIYATAGDQVRQIFLSIGDQLRRQYVLTYTSKQPADDKSHNLTVKVKYRGEASETKGSFTAKSTPLAFDVNGIADASTVKGTAPIQVIVTGGTAKQVSLLVDDQVRASASTTPYSLSWDTSKETPGPHKVIVRATDAAGINTDQKFVVVVESAAPTVAAPTATTMSAPTAANTAVPTAAAAPLPVASAGPNPLVYGGAGVLLVGAVAGGTAFALSRRKPARVVPPPVVAPPPKTPVLSDATEVVRPIKPIDSGATMMSAAAGPAATSGEATMMAHAPPPAPRARLRIVQDTGASDFIVDRPEVTLGRDPSNPIVIHQALASRFHARVYTQNGEFWVEDTKSLNGTKVNGEKISAPRKLAPNDQIKIGEVTLTFTPQ